MSFMVELAPEHLALLRCPVSRKPLVQKGDWLISTDPDTRLRYPIRDGIPVLLREEAEELSQSQWQEALEPTQGGQP